VLAYYTDNKLDQEDLIPVNKAIYHAYHNVYLANPSPLNSSIDSTSKNKLDSRFEAVDR
jgi:hypothetical protein